MADSSGGVLVLSASIGAGHDVAAHRLAADLRARGVPTSVADGLAAMGPRVRDAILRMSRYESVMGNRTYDVAYWAGVRSPFGRAMSGQALRLAGGDGLLRRIEAARPSLVVSTYPGTTQLLGRLRRSKALEQPAVATVTDLAGLDLWAHPDVDLHLVARPEAMPEVQAIAGERVVAARGLNALGFEMSPSREQARRALGWANDARAVLVSGGGWGVGDLEGAAAVALGSSADVVVVVCGRNPRALAAMEHRADADRRLSVLGFTNRMPELLAAVDVTVHSTGGLTALEAAVSGCQLVSYGWGRGHLRVNNRAFVATGLAAVANTPRALAAELARAFSCRRTPDSRWRTLPLAAEVILDHHPALLPPDRARASSLIAERQDVAVPLRASVGA